MIGNQEYLGNQLLLGDPNAKLLQKKLMESISGRLNNPLTGQLNQELFNLPLNNDNGNDNNTNNNINNNINNNANNNINNNPAISSNSNVQGNSIIDNTNPGKNNGVGDDYSEITRDDLDRYGNEASDMLKEGRFKEERRRLDEVQNTLDNQFKLRDSIQGQDPEEAYRRKVGNIDSATSNAMRSALRNIGPLSSGSFNTGAIEAGARTGAAMNAAMPLTQMRNQAADAVDAQRNALTQQEQYQDLNIANNAYGHTDFLDRSYNALEDYVIGGSALANYRNANDIDGNVNDFGDINSVKDLTPDEKALYRKASKEEQQQMMKNWNEKGRIR